MQAWKNILKARQVYYEHGDKAGSLLAVQLRQQSAEQWIPGINTGAGSVSQSPQVINGQLKSYYSTLYQSEVDISSSKLCLFLDFLDIPKRHPDARLLLEQPLSLEEIAHAIKLSQMGMAPQPIAFYREFCSKLAPILKPVYDE